MGEKNDYQLVACDSCGSVMTEPWVQQPDLNKFFGDVQPNITHLTNPEAQIAAMKKIILKIAPHVSIRRFLDISCRQGYGVMAAKELGFKAKGIDPHDFFITFAKDKYDADLFEHVSVPDYAASLAKADIIFSIESLCEQPDPDGYMAALSKILAPGGILYLQEPDGNHFMLPRKFAKWAFVDPPLNFSYLSKSGMRALLERHGLKIQKSFFSWKPFMKMIAVKE